MARPFCSHCGKEVEDKDVFCRKCGGKIKRMEQAVDGTEGVIVELKGLVESATERMKKELYSQVQEIESGLKSGRFTRKEFEAEAEEIKNRLLRFVK